ncbi:MAG: aminoacyl-tRNA hydrolase [Candidatus Shapirobacteria bacterium]
MKLIIGLGNPGEKYKNTRHNLGQKIILEYVQTIHESSFKNYSKFSAQLIEHHDFLIGISNEYMNNSGISVQKLSQFYKISPNDIYIVHDDLDLEVGDYKIQFDRGSAGHNGIKSIVEHLGTQAFNRIRIGVGKPTDSTPIEDYVLRTFSPEEKEKIDSVSEKVLTEISSITRQK